MQDSDKYDLSKVLEPIVLPCGRELRNRLVKAATYEHLAGLFGGPPTREILGLYSKWGKGGWGMIITGNVQISRKHLTLGADVVVPRLPSDEERKAFGDYARVIKGEDVWLDEGTGDGVACESASAPHGAATTVASSDDDSGARQPQPPPPLAIMQLSHAGRQSVNFVGGRWMFVPPLSASATRVGTRSTDQSVLSRALSALLFQTARAMTVEEIEDAIDGFVRGAMIAHRSGFDGVQLHAAHGYLLSQFISRKTNLRSDKYAAPLALLYEVVCAVRAAVPKSFVVGIKLNASDYVYGGFTEAQAQEHLAQIASWEWDGAGVDFVEVSGGDYESPDFMDKPSRRQAFFESFSRLALETVSKAVGDGPEIRPQKTPPLIVLTGGLRTRAQLASVLECKHAHLLGVARLAIEQPNLPRFLYQHAALNDDPSSAGGSVSGDARGNGDVPEDGTPLWTWETRPTPDPVIPLWFPRLLGAGVGTAWYTVAMRYHGRDRKDLPYGKGWGWSVLHMYCTFL